MAQFTDACRCVNAHKDMYFGIDSEIHYPNTPEDGNAGRITQ